MTCPLREARAPRDKQLVGKIETGGSSPEKHVIPAHPEQGASRRSVREPEIQTAGLCDGNWFDYLPERQRHALGRRLGVVQIGRREMPARPLSGIANAQRGVGQPVQPDQVLVQ
jgi:hypothetical protein